MQNNNVECACGCGSIFPELDSSGRRRAYVTGHNNRKYDREDKHAHQKAWVKRNRPTVNGWKAKKHRAAKVRAIQWKGGFCEECWLVYDGTNGAVFHFHHTDPSIKEDGITKMLTNKSWDKVLVELGKCIMLCANCHLITHNGEY